MNVVAKDTEWDDFDPTLNEFIGQLNTAETRRRMAQKSEKILQYYEHIANK